LWIHSTAFVDPQHRLCACQDHAVCFTSLYSPLPLVFFSSFFLLRGITSVLLPSVFLFFVRCSSSFSLLRAKRGWRVLRSCAGV
jgi:hypothetical protein